MQKLLFNITNEKLFFTSDLHIGHRNIINFCKRPFINEKDMATALVNNWNSVVSNNDYVFDLGDMFWFDSRHEVKNIVNKLNGTIFKLAGNHDMRVRSLFELCAPEKVVICDDIVQLFISGISDKRVKEVWASHFPLATWPHFENGSIQLFGHIHSGPLSENAVDVVGKDLILKPTQYDVGVDNNNFTPIEIRDIYSKLNIIL